MISTFDLIAKFEKALSEKWGYIWGTAGVLWTEARHKALLKTTDENRASSRKVGAKWIGHTVSDCSGLFSWAFRSLGGYMYHGSNTMYKSYCTDHGALTRGVRSDGLPVLPGTAVFCYHDGRYTHVGLFVGNNRVIEASSPSAGVIASKLTDKKWVAWGELKGVDYASAPAPGPAPSPSPSVRHPTLRRGSRGEEVRLMQSLLISLGYPCGLPGADGIFGRLTYNAVRAFQKAKRIGVDGICGPITWGELEKADAEAHPVSGLTPTASEGK